MVATLPPLPACLQPAHKPPGTACLPGRRHAPPPPPPPFCSPQINEEVKKVLGTVGTGVGDIVGNAKSMLMGGLLGGADAAAAVPAAVATGAQAFTYTR